jgi:hypothetical protein
MPDDAKCNAFSELRKQGVIWIGASLGCIRLFFWCQTLKSIQILRSWLDSGRLSKTISALFSSLVLNHSPIAVQLQWNVAQLNSGERYFMQNIKPQGYTILTAVDAHLLHFCNALFTGNVVV